MSGPSRKEQLVASLERIFGDASLVVVTQLRA